MNERTAVPANPPELKRMEIIEWWEAEHARVFDACCKAAEEISKACLENEEEKMGLEDTVYDNIFGQKKQERMRGVVEAGIETFCRALAASLHMPKPLSVKMEVPFTNNKIHLQTTIRNHPLTEDDSTPPTVWAHFKKVIDDARDIRLRQVESNDIIP
ncbi:MAG: hypothetical protein OXC91_10865 [Rhodobacteraceae bacterium]|nr:hypothetical protein [Paracoccaceae bacterium]